MRRFYDCLMLCMLFASPVLTQNTDNNVRITGIVTYFEGQPVADADVYLFKDTFTPAYQAKTDDKGQYSVEVKRGIYLGLAIVKDYRVKNLEFWAWNVLAFNDLEIDARIGRLELYGMNAFKIQGGMPSLHVYFRPMSLNRFLKLSEESKSNLQSLPVIDIAPKLKKEDIAVKINKKPIEIVALNTVEEATQKNQKMVAYLIQLALPNEVLASGTASIAVVLKDRETGGQGEGIVFWNSQLKKKLCE